MDSLIEIFCNVDDFCQDIENVLNRQLIATGAKKRNRLCQLSLSEMMTIQIYFHHSSYRNFKSYYTKHVVKYLKGEFPRLPSYNRFVEHIPRTLLPMSYYLHSLKGECTGISFVDSYCLKVCHNKRIDRNKVFDGIAERSKSTMGYFFGFKLHLVVNERGEMLNFCYSRGNMDDRRPLLYLAEELYGKLFGDKGYISKRIFKKLMKQGVQVVTYKKKGMKGNDLMPLMDRILLRKRSIIETIGDLLKNVCQIEHTRHRSPINFLVNLVTSLIAYCHLPKKPSIKFTDAEQKMLTSSQNHLMLL